MSKAEITRTIFLNCVEGGNVHRVKELFYEHQGTELGSVLVGLLAVARIKWNLIDPMRDLANELLAT